VDLEPLRFRGGTAGALLPFALFLAGVAWLGLSGAPDERGFWPVVLFALVLGLTLAKDRGAFCEAALSGMSRPVVALMIAAWLFAGCLGSLLAGSGFVAGLVWLAGSLGLRGALFVAACFLIASALSMATGTSLGTLLVCGPLLYPAGVTLGADPALLMGAVLAGATFGDSLSPLSDTTIASALTQDADVPGVVRARLKYALPAALLALFVYLGLGAVSPGAPAAATVTPALPTGVSSAPAPSPSPLTPSPAALPMGLAPLLVLVLLLRRRHLVEALLFGILAAVSLGLGLRLLRPAQLMFIDAERYSARGLLLEGLERGVGVSIFTMLLMGLVATLEATGLQDRLVKSGLALACTPRRAEAAIVGALSAAVMVTTHSVVAILAVGPFARQTGERLGLTAYRRANLLDLTACTWPFLLPWFIPTILAAGTTAAGEAFGLPRLSPLAVGLRNVYSWALVGMVGVAVITGFGRAEAPRS
jgi:Na+/H+ antiporter NhaC